MLTSGNGYDDVVYCSLIYYEKRIFLIDKKNTVYHMT